MKTDSSKKLRMQILLSKVILLIGILLMGFKIYADSEPGAIPLLLVVVGAGWYFFNRIQLRSKSQTE